MAAGGRKRLVAAVAALGMALLAADAGAVATRGGVTCAQWLQDKKADAWEITADQFWLLGYLSGLAVGLNQDFLRSQSNDAIYSWIDNHCLANPTQGLGEAANALASELIKAGGPKSP